MEADEIVSKVNTLREARLKCDRARGSCVDARLAWSLAEDAYDGTRRELAAVEFEMAQAVDALCVSEEVRGG